MLELIDLDDATDFRECWAAMEPTHRERHLLWSIRCIQNETGKPYDHFEFPHIGAPGGPMDAFDDQTVREIPLQWGSRLGKTFFGQCATIYNGTKLRLPQIFGSTKEKLAIQVVKRTYKMIRQCVELAAKLIHPERLQSQHLIEFWGCCVFVGWARSAATFADKDCAGGHGNEIDDWDHLTTSKDGDPLKQFLERFKNHWGGRKVILESIPKIKGKSRIEAKRLEGTCCEFQVPCPHCRRYQLIELGTPETPYGIKWEGSGDMFEAWYECRHCRAKIRNHERREMMRRGVWVPEGCTVKDAEAWAVDVMSPDYEWLGWEHAVWIEGKPAKNQEIASYRLASYCSLKLSWNDCAKEWISCDGKPQKLRNFFNQWDARTWEIRRSRTRPEEVAARLKTEYAMGEVPEWAEFLSLGADRQRADGGFVKWVIWALGPDDMSHLLYYGTSETLDAMWKEVGRRPFYKPDGSEPLYVGPVAADSGWDAPGTYAFCRDETHDNCVPCKGGNTAGETDSYKWTELEKSKHKEETDGMSLLLVSTNFTETALQHRLDNLSPGDTGSISLCKDAAEDSSFIAEFTNASLIEKFDPRGEPVLLWGKKDEATPNDWRDAARYGLEVGQAWRDSPDFSMGGAQRVAVEKRADGRDWIENE